jgi:hypothetical protein
MRIMASSDSVYSRLLGQFRNRVQERVHERVLLVLLVLRVLRVLRVQTSSMKFFLPETNLRM